MAFPTLGTPTAGNSGANATAHTVTLPAFTTGDRVVVALSNDGADVSAEVTTPATGWTKIAGPLDENAAVHAGGLNAWYRDMQAGDAATIEITTGASEGTAFACELIESGTFDSGTAPAVATFEAAGSSATPDPPSLAPAWGAADTLWIVVYGWDGNVAHSSYPADFTLGQATSRWANTGGASIAIAARELNAASLDPAAGAIASTEQWASITIAIRPGAGGESHSTTVVGTGSGTAALVDAGDHAPAPSGTAAGTAALVDAGEHTVALIGTGAGTAALVVDVETGDHPIAITGTAAGVGILELAGAHGLALAGTGAGTATLVVDVPEAHSAAITGTGAGTGVLALTTARGLALVATGSGTALLLFPFRGCIVAGVNFDVRGDVGLEPFILDRDLLNANPGSELTSAAAAAETSIGAMLLRATWRRGPTAVLGPLTTAAAGRARLSLVDTERLFDPLNAESPIRLSLRLGARLRILAGDVPAFTGTLRTWSHDLGDVTSTLELVGPIGELAGYGIPGGSVTLPDAPLGRQAQAVLEAADWPLERFELPGLSTFSMASFGPSDFATLNGRTPLEILDRLRLAELAELTETRDGLIRWRGPGWPYEPDPSALINCGGVFLESLESAIDESRLRNVVSIPDVDPFGTTGVAVGEFSRSPELGRHALEAHAAELRLLAMCNPFGEIAASGAAQFSIAISGSTAADRVDAYEIEVIDDAGTVFWSTGVVVIAPIIGAVVVTYAGTPLVAGDRYRWRGRTRLEATAEWFPYVGGVFTITGTTPADPPYAAWSTTILEALGSARSLTALGTIRPRAWDEIAATVLADAGDRWLVVDDHVTPALAIEVRVHGLSVTLAPAQLEVDALTEDVA